MPWIHRRLALPMVAACAIAQTPGCKTPTPDPRLAASRTAAQALGADLKTRLSDAMTADGVEAAVTVCSDQGPAIAARISERMGARVGRTAMRYRNPDNAPTDWQQTVLEDFATRLAAAEQAPEYAGATPEGGYRYMKAIPTAPMCLVCHGDIAAGDLADTLARLYPDDRATGFTAGELRGAFVVEWAP